MPDHDKDKKPPKPQDLFRKAAAHLRQASEQSELAVQEIEAGREEKSHCYALKAHAQQLEATKHLNEAIKHLMTKKDETEKPIPVGAGSKM